MGRACHQPHDLGFNDLDLEVSCVEYHRLAFPENTDHTELMNASTLVVKIMFMTDCSLLFQATYDIRNHLRFNCKTNTLEIFHRTSFLKEQLRSTREVKDASSMSSCIRL